MEESGGGGGRNIFVLDSEHGDILDDANENHTWVYYLTHVLQVVYGLGFVASAILFVNAHVVHTHFFPGAPNNDLYSERYTSLWWWVLCFGTLRFAFFICMQWLFTFRNTMCGAKTRRFPGCTLVWLVLMVLLLAADVVGLVVNSYYLATCNGLDAYGNPCNAPGWCCYPDVRVRPGNHCPNEFSASCPVLPPLDKEPTFLGIFSINVVFVALELYFVLLPLVLWFKNFNTLQSIKRVQSIKNAVEERPKPNPSAPPLETPGKDTDPSLADTAATAPPATENANVLARIRAGIDTAAVLRRPYVPQTPLLAAAGARPASGPVVHVTPPSVEKNTKQP